MYFLICEINADICGRLCKTSIYKNGTKVNSTVNAHAYFIRILQRECSNATELSKNTASGAVVSTEVTEVTLEGQILPK